MKLIAHRVNTIEELLSINTACGVEIDLRDNGKDIIIQHDPFTNGTLLADYLSNYRHGLLILNIKSEGIEFEVLKLLKKFDITNYLFLDSSFPMIKKLIDFGENNIAIRFSEYEGLDTLKSMGQKCKYVWIDCFNFLPLNKVIEIELHQMAYQLILVSPELQERTADIGPYKQYLTENKILVDYVCTKSFNFQRWEST